MTEELFAIIMIPLALVALAAVLFALFGVKGGCDGEGGWF